MKNFTLALILILGNTVFSQCTLTLNVTNASDSSTCNGGITATPTNGTAPYTYYWNNGANTNAITNLCAGTTYTVTVADQFGCSATATATVGLAANPCSSLSANVSVTSATGLNQCDGTVSVNGSGGAPPYTYSIAGNGMTYTGSSMFGNVCPGNYTVNVFDANGCNYTTYCSVVASNNPCANFSISLANITNASSPSSCDGSVSVSATGGVAPFSYLWNNGQIGSVASSLCSGVYQVCVTDANGCLSCDSVFIFDSTNVCQGFYATAQTTNATDAVTCDGSMSVVANGGTAPYTYNFANAGTTATAINLCVGVYTATVIDANGCFATVVGNVLSNANSGDTLIINGNVFIDSTIVGVDSSTWINNCSIYYDSVINGYINNFSVLGTDSILVSWVLGYNNGDSIIVNSIYNMNSGNGTYLLTLLLYCPVKSVPKYLMVSSDFEYQFSSLNEEKLELLYVYPNPAENFLQVKGLKDGELFKITDLNDKEITLGTYNQVIDISKLGHGTYLLIVSGRNQNQVLRFIK